MSIAKVTLSASDGIASVTLNRPEKLNAIDNELAQQLLDAIDAANRDEEIRVILVRGAGRAFCAGRDVGAAPTDRDLELTQAVARALVETPKLVVTAVHGWTVGAGFEWMLDSDVLLAADSARFKLPEASLGVFVTGGLTALLPAAVGLARAKALMLTGEEFSAHQAADWGLVWRVVPEAQLGTEAIRVARQLAALEPGVAAQFKRVVNEVGSPLFARAIEQETMAQRAISSRRAA